MDKQRLIEQNRQFFTMHLLMHCFLKEGELRKQLADTEGAGIQMAFSSCGGVKNELRIMRDTGRLLREKQVSPIHLAYYSGHGKSDPSGENWTFPIKECGVEVTLKIVEYRLCDGDEHTAIKNPKDNSIRDDEVLGRVVVLTAKIVETVPA